MIHLQTPGWCGGVGTAVWVLHFPHDLWLHLLHIFGSWTAWTQAIFDSEYIESPQRISKSVENHNLNKGCVANLGLEVPDILYFLVSKHVWVYTSSTAQGGGGSFKNRKPIGEVGCCASGMAERIHWWTERCLRFPLVRSLSLTIYLPMYLSIYRSISLSPSLFHLSICLSVYLSTCLSTYLSIYLSVCLSVCLPIYLSIYLSLSLSRFHLSTCLSVCLSIYLSTCLSVYLSTCGLVSFSVV